VEIDHLKLGRLEKAFRKQPGVLSYQDGLSTPVPVTGVPLCLYLPHSSSPGQLIEASLNGQRIVGLCGTTREEDGNRELSCPYRPVSPPCIETYPGPVAQGPLFNMTSYWLMEVRSALNTSVNCPDSGGESFTSPTSATGVARGQSAPPSGPRPVRLALSRSSASTAPATILQLFD